jgi:vacuolar-type H+-ATPase subunit I/STV1
MKSCNLRNLLEQKLDVFRDFLSATMILKELTDSEDDMKKIELLIDKRRSCINKIDKIDNRINRTRKEIITLPLETKKEITKIVTMIDDTAVKAVHTNKEFETMLRVHHNDIRNQMLKARHSRDGVKEYVRRTFERNQPRFLDVTS